MSDIYWKKSDCEYLRYQAKQKFNQVKETWIECGKWTLPHRVKWMLAQTPGARNNYHIVDPTHILSLRSYVAGFLEGNTSASRPWFRIGGQTPEASESPENHQWLDTFTRRCLYYLGITNFYNAAGQYYYDFGTFGTGTHLIDEFKGGFYVHTLEPGSYYIINNSHSEAIVLVREFQLSVKACVEAYGKKKNGKVDWSNFSTRVRKLYEDGNYTQMVDIVNIIKENEYWDPNSPQAMMNRRWVSLTYEVGSTRGGQYYQVSDNFGNGMTTDPEAGEDNVFLKKSATKRKPFIVGRGDANGNYEYGETSPTINALGLIKSLNKKAIAKDQALEHMIKPALQGPSSLKKSYVSSNPNTFIPLDPTSLAQKGLRPIFEINPAFPALVSDVMDMRSQVDKLYYADYLLYLSRNPKTRTATETNAIVQEQQLIIGPNLQSLNWTYNVPIVEFVMDWVLDNDPHLPPPPPALGGQFLRAQFISVFAQAQKAADLPSIERYVAMIEQVGQLPGGMKIWDKVNLDKLADLYEDRLYLPAGLNNPQAKVDAYREQQQRMQMRQQALQQTLPAVAGAAKDLGLQANGQQQPQQK